MWIMCVDTWEKLGRSAYGEVLKLNEWIGCFPTDKWRLDKTDPHCSIVLSKVFFVVDLQIKDRFHCWESITLHGVSAHESAWTKEKKFKFRSPWCPLPLKRECPLTAMCTYRVWLGGTTEIEVCTYIYIYIYILHNRHRYKLQSSIIINRKI